MFPHNATTIKIKKALNIFFIAELFFLLTILYNIWKILSMDFAIIMSIFLHFVIKNKKTLDINEHFLFYKIRWGVALATFFLFVFLI